MPLEKRNEAMEYYQYQKQSFKAKRLGKQSWNSSEKKFLNVL